MSRWFRTYDDIINDPKILALPEAMRWIWMAMLCIASKHDGVLPSIEVIALSLRVKPPKASDYLAKLVAAELIDRLPDGRCAPHNWAARQYKSDTSTERVKRHRESKRSVSCNVSETPPETEKQKTEDGGGSARVRATPAISEEAFRVADALAVACGIPAGEVEYVRGWDGCARWVQACLDANFPADLMIATAKRVARAKRDGPIEHFAYLKKPIERAVLEFNQPPPTVGVSPDVPAQRNLQLYSAINGGGAPRRSAGNGFLHLAEHLNRKLADG